MNALFISNDPAIFDADSPVRERIRKYAAKMGSLTVLSRGRREHESEYAEGRDEGVLHLKLIRGGKLGAWFGLVSEAKRVIRERKIEIVSAQDPFEYGLAALFAVGRTKVKLHIQVHTDFCSPWFTRAGNMRSPKVRMPFVNHIRRMLADHVLPKADGIRAVSKRVRASLISRYGSRIVPASVIPIASSIALPAPAPLPEHPFTFAFMTTGRLEPEKRIEDILVALARIKDLYPSAGLIVAGSGRSKGKLEAMARRLKLKGRVVFLGWRTDATALLRSAQCYIQASAYEGYGLTLIEAALARVPIITTDVGVVGEVLRGYEEVLVAPPGDPAALAVHMASIIEDTASRTALAMRAEDAAKKHLAEHPDQPAEVTEDLMGVLQKL